MKTKALLFATLLFTCGWIWAQQGELSPQALRMSGSGGTAFGQLGSIVVPLEGIGGTTVGNIYIAANTAGEMTGTGDLTADAGYKLTVYPNPSAEQITVSACVADGYRLYNLSGAVVMSGKLAGTDVETHIDIAALPAQTYMFAITDKQGKTLATARIIKN